MFAVLETGGKQYRVAESDRIRVEKLEAEPGDELTLDRVLLLGDEDGVRVGAPYVEGASVTVQVARQGLGRKIEGFKYKAKKNVRKRYGHRQPFTELVVRRISA
jgi:large subunit ribosomal protein L21